jgi:hypothetical protein
MRRALQFFILALLVSILPKDVLGAGGHVLLVNSYHQGFQWVRDYTESMMKQLDSDVSLTSFDLDTKRIPETQFVAKANEAISLIDVAKPDVVVLADDNALMLLGQKVKDRGIPIVFLGVNGNPRDVLKEISGITGVLERPLLKRSVLSLNEVFDQQFRRIAVLFDITTTSKMLLERYFKSHRMQFEGYRADLEMFSTFDEWKHFVSTCVHKGYDALLLGVYNRLLADDGKTMVPYRDVARWTAVNSAVPVFAFWEFSVAPDMAAGGLVLSGKDQGASAGDMVMRILRGADVSDMSPVIARQGMLLFSRGGLQHWNLTIPEEYREVVELIE